MKEQIFLCQKCDANWTQNEYTNGCPQCDGGDMKRPCILCDGRCGAIYLRAVIDSWDTGEAHWIGSCKLPEDEKLKLIKERLDKKHK